MASGTKRGHNEPPPRPIIVKKIVEGAHDAHHGGAWKIAYADFVTAMMAFFLLMWLLGATDEQKRRGLADYFTPTLIEYRQGSAGSNGIMGGDSIVAQDNYPARATQTGSRSMTIPRDVTGGLQEGQAPRELDAAVFARLREELERRINSDPQLRRLRSQVSFTDTDEGLRIDLMDEADYSMFRLGTAELLPEAHRLVGEVAQVIDDLPNNVIVRGHTDSLPYSGGQTMNNWMLSTARAETTRATLQGRGLAYERFTRIEGVADREPFVSGDRYDPRNRRISITLARRSSERAQPTRIAAALPVAVPSGR